ALPISQLEIDIKRIQNSESLSLALNNAHVIACSSVNVTCALNNAHVTLTDEHAITDRLYELSNQLQSISEILPDKYDRLKEDVDRFYYTLEDAKHQLYDDLTNTEFDEQYLNELESRMNLLNSLKRKYGKDINELIIYQDKMADEINKIENYEESTAQLRQEIDDLYHNVIELGEKLSKERRK